MKNKLEKIDNQLGNGVLPCVSGRLSSIKKGDKLLIKDNRYCEIDNCVDIYEVTKEDEKSFLAGSSICGWWFYKDTLNPYSGDATIIGILNDVNFSKERTEVCQTPKHHNYEIKRFGFCSRCGESKDRQTDL